MKTTSKAAAIAGLWVSTTVALVPYQAVKVGSPLQNRRLYYKSLHDQDERYWNASILRRGKTATRPSPTADAEAKLVHPRSSFRPLTRSQIKPGRKSSNGINGQMVKNLILSQATLLSLTTAVALAATTLSGVGFLDSLQWMESPNLFGDLAASSVLGRCLLGSYAAIPMVFVSQLVDQAASQRDASHVHFSTTNMVVSLFGRRHRNASAPSTSVPEHKTKTTSTVEAVLSSLGLSFCTSFAEEVMFRGYLPALILALSHSPALAWLGQSIVFGLCHIHPLAQQGENRIVAATQTFNALFGYGLVYAMTGGDLWPCIMAHGLYDTHVMVSSWRKVNCQIDWTEDAVQESLSESDAAALQQLRAWAGPSLTSENLNLCRRFFYAFDEDHKRALSLPNVQRAVSYAFLSDSRQPSSVQVERSFEKALGERGQPVQGKLGDRITLSEFVRLLFSLRAQTLQVAP